METQLAFFSWSQLTTCGGALVMVMILTELTKALPGIRALPTQLWSYLLTLLVMYPAAFFTGTLTGGGAVLILFNAAVIALAANGGYEALQRIMASVDSGHSSER